MKDAGTSPGKRDAIIEVIDIMQRHALTLNDIASMLDNPRELKVEKSSGILSRLFGYIGGIFVFLGLAIYVGMKWNDLGPVGRIMVTLGPGFCAFVLALVCTSDARVEKMATPLFLTAALLQPTGILVMMKEYSHGGDPAYALLFMNFLMLVQQGCAFKARDRTVLALTTIFFSSCFFAIAFDLMHVNHHLIGVTLGLSLTCIAWSLGRSRHQSIAALNYFAGSVLFLATSYDYLHNTALDVLFLGLASGTIYLSTLARSRTLLLVGTLAMIGYIGNYIAVHFAHNLNAPLMLMLMGFVLIALGVLAVKINNTYIRQA